MVFTLAIKYFRYQGQHSDVKNHVTMPENNIFAHCATLSLSIRINSSGWKDVAMGDIAMASLLFPIKN